MRPANEPALESGKRNSVPSMTGASAPRHHQLLDFGNCLGGVETLRAGLRAVHDGMAAIQAEWILEAVEPFAGRFVAAVDDPAIGLQEDGRPQIAVAVPPIARTTGCAAEAEDAF